MMKRTPRGTPGGALGAWRIGRAVALLVALGACWPQAAGAGEFRFVLEGEAGVRNDGNYGRLTGLDGEQDPLNQDQGDQSVGRAGLNLQFSYALQRLNLALDYSPSYERSLKDSDLSGTTHRLDFGVSGELTRRLRMDIRERLLSTPNLDLYAPAAVAETTTVAPRGDQLSHTLDVAFSQSFNRRSSLLLGATHSLRKFEDEDLFDSEALNARIGAGFDLERGRRIEAAAGLGQYDYQDRGDADVRTVGLAWVYDGRSNHLRLEGGAFWAESTDRRLLLVLPGEPGLPGETRTVLVQESDQGWRGGVQFSQERQLLRWAVGLSHDISPGAGVGRAVEADNAFLGLSIPVGRRLELGLDGSGSRQNDLSSRQDAQDLGDRQSDLTEFAAGTARAAWTFAPAFRLEGGYSRVWQSSRVASFGDLNYARYFLSLAVRLYSTGETPKAPGSLGRPTDEEPDDQ
jgi:hypothetical protein